MQCLIEMGYYFSEADKHTIAMGAALITHSVIISMR